MSATTTLEAVRNWPLEEQLELVFGLWDQIVDRGWRPTPSPELAAELERRLAAHDADPSRALSWEQVVAHVRGPIWEPIKIR
ncbi:MAG: addiction module protein [Zavarzinella sp.]|nr:addiction module protein [Zavarzinella sp.]